MIRSAVWHRTIRRRSRHDKLLMLSLMSRSCLVTQHRCGEASYEDVCKQFLVVVFGILLDFQHPTRRIIEVRRSWQWTIRIRSRNSNVRLSSGQSLALQVTGNLQRGAVGASKKNATLIAFAYSLPSLHAPTPFAML